MNSFVSINTEQALIDYLTPLFPWAACIIGASDKRNADEDQYGIIGEYVPLPAIVVSVGQLSVEATTAPVFHGQVTVTVRSSSELTTVDTHRRNTSKVSDALWDQEALFNSIDETQHLTLSSIFSTGEEFTREGRKLESRFTFDIIISGKDE